jgi:hypothetical protein
MFDCVNLVPLHEHVACRPKQPLQCDDIGIVMPMDRAPPCVESVTAPACIGFPI